MGVKVSQLYDQGESQYREDGMFAVYPYFGVLDGVSAPYGPKMPMRKFGGFSGGELVSRTIEYAMYILSNSGRKLHLLCDMVIQTNDAVFGEQRVWYPELMRHDSDKLAGATFAFACVGEEEVEIAQAGDCFAVVINKHSMPVLVTRNQVRGHDTEMNAAIDRTLVEVAADAEFMRSVGAPGSVKWGAVEAEPYVGKIRGEMWNRFAVYLGGERKKDVNSRNPRGYGLMNGQPELFDVMFYTKYPRVEVKTILLFTDGMIPWHVMKSKSDFEIGVAAYDVYHHGGLGALLASARGAEEEAKNQSYTNTAEATAVAIEL